MTLEKRSGKYVAQIVLDGKKKKIGRFATPEVAHAAYCDVATRHFKEFSRPA